MANVAENKASAAGVTRPDGLYWIKLHSQGLKTIFWEKGGFWFLGADKPVHESDILEIGPLVGH